MTDPQHCSPENELAMELEAWSRNLAGRPWSPWGTDTRILLEKAAAALRRHAQCAPMPDRALLLIQQLAWYYDVNDCSERHEDDALEVPLLDLRAAKEIAAELNLPDGPVPVQRFALTSTERPNDPFRAAVIEECARFADRITAQHGRTTEWHAATCGVPAEIRALSTVTSTDGDSPVMGAAKRAAKVVEGWSDAKRDYADRVTSTVQHPVENKDGGAA